jgi:vacuolar-type H+-ATPase subunit F/Vma7
MSGIVALGERRRVEGFALAGVRVLVAPDAEAARAAWPGLERDVAVLLLTPGARRALADLLPSRPDIIWTVLPA